MVRVLGLSEPDISGFPFLRFRVLGKMGLFASRGFRESGLGRVPQKAGV